MICDYKFHHPKSVLCRFLGVDQGVLPRDVHGRHDLLVTDVVHQLRLVLRRQPKKRHYKYFFHITIRNRDFFVKNAIFLFFTRFFRCFSDTAMSPKSRVFMFFRKQSRLFSCFYAKNRGVFNFCVKTIAFAEYNSKKSRFRLRKV